MTHEVRVPVKLCIHLSLKLYLLTAQLCVSYANKQYSTYVLINDVSTFFNCIYKRNGLEEISQGQMESGNKIQAQTSLALVPYDESTLPVFHKQNREFNFGNLKIKIKQNWQESGVAAVVWDAALVLGEYLYHHPHEVSQKQVIELGAGTGLAGIIAAVLGGEVTLTDRDIALENLQANVDLNLNTLTEAGVHQNKDNLIKVKELSWGKNLHNYQSHSYDVILGADIIYIEETFPLLLQTLISLANCNTKILISCKIRYERDHKFLNMMKESFNINEISYDKARDIHLYEAIKIC